MNTRLKGPLDPLIERMPNKKVIELAKEARVSRNTLLAWQKDTGSISTGSRVVLQLLAKKYGVKLPFLYEPTASPSDRYTCGSCGKKGHRKSYCPSRKAVN